MLQLGLSPSHFNFLFLHIMHARRLGLGTLEFPADPPSVAASPFWSETMIVSGGVPDDDDIFGRRRCAWLWQRYYKGNCPTLTDVRDVANRIVLGLTQFQIKCLFGVPSG